MSSYISKDPGVKTYQQQYCFQTGQGYFDNGEAACSNALFAIYPSSSQEALRLLTDKQRAIEGQLEKIGYTKDYGKLPHKSPRSSAVSSGYGARYHGKAEVDCTITTDFPANSATVRSLYLDAFQNLAAVEIRCDTQVGSYFYENH